MSRSTNRPGTRPSSPGRLPEAGHPRDGPPPDTPCAERSRPHDPRTALHQRRLDVRLWRASRGGGRTPRPRLARRRLLRHRPAPLLRPARLPRAAVLYRPRLLPADPRSGRDVARPVDRVGVPRRLPGRRGVRQRPPHRAPRGRLHALHRRTSPDAVAAGHNEVFVRVDNMLEPAPRPAGRRLQLQRRHLPRCQSDRRRPGPHRLVRHRRHHPRRDRERATSHDRGGRQRRAAAGPGHRHGGALRSREHGRLARAGEPDDPAGSPRWSSSKGAVAIRSSGIPISRTATS